MTTLFLLILWSFLPPDGGAYFVRKPPLPAHIPLYGIKFRKADKKRFTNDSTYDILHMISVGKGFVKRISDKNIAIPLYIA
jgi:hypothetical protein